MLFAPAVQQPQLCSDLKCGSWSPL